MASNTIHRRACVIEGIFTCSQDREELRQNWILLLNLFKSGFLLNHTYNCFKGLTRNNTQTAVTHKRTVGKKLYLFTLLYLLIPLIIFSNNAFVRNVESPHFACYFLLSYGGQRKRVFESLNFASLSLKACTVPDIDMAACSRNVSAILKREAMSCDNVIGQFKNLSLVDWLKIYLMFFRGLSWLSIFCVLCFFWFTTSLRIGRRNIKKQILSFSST